VTNPRWIVLGSLFVAFMDWQSACGAFIGMPAGSTVWMEFSSNRCDGDCVGSNQAGPNPSNGIPLSTFTSDGLNATVYAEILPDRVRTLNSGRSGHLHASFEDSYTVGGAAGGPFDIPVELHVTGVARSNGSGTCSICHQLVGANGEAGIGIFQASTDPLFQEGVRVIPFGVGSEATFFFATQAASSPFEHPIDVTASYLVQNVNVGDTFVLAYGVNSRLARGEIDLLNTGLLSFDLPDGVYLTSALAESLVPEPGGLALLTLGLCVAATRPFRRSLANRAS